MGVTHKLKPEVKDFVLQEKKIDPALSCRKISVLILEKFQVNISKSSINTLFKEANLSMPVGRRPKNKRLKTKDQRPKIDSSGGLNLRYCPDGSSLKIELAQPEIRPVLLPKIEPAVLLEVKPEIIIKPPVIISPQPLVIASPTPSVIASEAKQSQNEIASSSLKNAPHRNDASEETTGIILLKAVDYLTGGSYYIVDAIKRRLDTQSSEILAKTESLLYGLLFGSSPDLESYLAQLQSTKGLSSDIFTVILNVFGEVRCVKVTLSDGSDFYLDGQMHTVWSTPHIPYDFSTALYNIRSCVNKYFKKKEFFPLFMAPGYDIPTKEFFDFLLSFEAEEKQISRLTLYNNKFEEVEAIPIEKNPKRSFIFGLWPWQFSEYRRVKKLGEFRPFSFSAGKKNFYLADIEVELSGPQAAKTITLRGCALKSGPQEKTRLIILSNFTPGECKSEELLNIYINHWPNLEEAFQDYSRKIELFTYTADSQHFLSIEELKLNEESLLVDISKLLYCYLRGLDLYFKWHFLPSGYEDQDLALTSGRFYGLKTATRRESGYTIIDFKPPQGYGFLKDLEYALARLNEREIILNDGSRLWCNIG